MLLEAPARLRCVVSQGCRPIGEPYVVTGVEANVISELDGRPPMELLQTLRWAAVHYVSPLAALIPKAAPPNLAIRGAVDLDELPQPAAAPQAAPADNGFEDDIPF